ncbi:lactonase family protein [Nocardia alni]|uniref:lactonase family protein n=1 Tax=Nocardia alni TaxID=2815723 RepID=UPI001C224C76|nr:beta-propeller fold lactonase family protein [Nocardia alni]
MTSGSKPTGDTATTTDAADRPKQRPTRREWWVAALATIVLPGMVVLPMPAAALADSPTVSSPAYHLYAHGFLSDGLAGYNATDTAPPQPIPEALSGMASWPQTASPDGRFLYVASAATRTLLVYGIGHDGRLTALGGMALPDIPVDIAFTPDSHHAYVVMGAADASIMALTIRDDGTPVQNGPTVPFGTPTDGVSSVVVSPDGRNLYAASYLMDQLVRFSISGDGTVTAARQRVSTGSGPIYPTITPDGRHLYISNERGGSVSGYAVAGDGTLIPIAGSPFPSGLLPHVMSVTPDGKYVYVPNMGSSFISAYAVRPDGALHPLPDAPFGNSPLGPMSESSVMSPSGNALWALGTDPVRIGQNILRRYHIGAGGVLAPDETAIVQTGTRVADGRTLTLALIR